MFINQHSSKFDAKNKTEPNKTKICECAAHFDLTKYV